ncbi:MAG: hypothetical protein GIW98_02650 [Candidatus Eremiobacteraeota bacterium]|nr:hypothetical protein [Candidatus Eremiobacteraeota bacterium]
MFDIAPQLQAALSAAQSQITASAGQTARSGTRLGVPYTDVEMAGFASRALFSEALLSALHARLAEIKAVTK